MNDRTDYIRHRMILLTEAGQAVKAVAGWWILAHLAALVVRLVIPCTCQ